MTLEDVADQLLLPILGDTDPAALELSPEEVERSDLEQFTEEGTERDPDSECAPLIDPLV